jgi:hypothetical protein
VDFHIAAMYRTKAYQTSGQVAKLVAEREGMDHKEREQFLANEARKAMERLKTLETFGTDQLERIYEKARTVSQAIHDHNCQGEGGCNGKRIAELGWEKYIEEATEQRKPEANRSREYLKMWIVASRQALTEQLELIMHMADGNGVGPQKKMNDNFHMYMHEVQSSGSDNMTLRIRGRQVNDAIATLKTYVNTAPLDTPEWGAFPIKFCAPETLNRYMALPICHNWNDKERGLIKLNEVCGK